MSALQRAFLLRPQDGVSSGDRVSHWLQSTRQGPAEELDRGDIVELKEAICLPSYEQTPSPKQDKD